MYVIEIRIQGSEKFSEILPQALRVAECMVEDLVSCSLLEIFDALTVEEVVVRHVPTEYKMTALSIDYV